MTTNASGGYLFAGLAAGNYRVSLTAANFAIGGKLSGCRPTGDADGVGSANQSTTSVVTNGSQLAQNFGYQFNPADSTAVSIGDTVYSDANNNGAEDVGEGGIPDITVDLYEDTAGNGVMDAGDVKITTVSTADGVTDDLDGDGEIDAVGFYIFRGLDPSRKYIADADAEDPDFMVAFGSPGSQSSADKLACGDFASGNCSTADFGFFSGPPASIGDQVFIDHNFDGVYNSGDLPIAGLVMELFIDTNGDGIANETRRAATTTDATGKYRFSNLGSAAYLIRFSTLDPAIPAGTTTLVDQRAASIASGQDYNDADFHFVRLLNKSTNMPAGRAGETLTYTLEPNIPGSGLVSNLMVSDVLPTGTIYAGAATPPPSAQPALGGSGAVQWDLGSTVPAAPGAIVSPGYTPTSVVQTTTAQVVDTFVSQGNATSIEGTGSELKTKPEAGDAKAALISFVLPTLASTDVIDRAVVRLTVSSARSANHTVTLRALNTAWTEAAAVWNDSDGTGTGDWATAGVFGALDYGTTSYGSYNAPYLVGQTLEFDVTSLVRGWRDGTIPNRGVALVPTGTDNGDLKFFSSEGQTVGEKPGPRLIVQYSSLGNATNATLLDDFTTKHYEMNTGTKMWTGGWVEVGDDGKPGNGKIEISSGLLVVPDSANCSIYRSANLSGATAAAFEFNLTTNPLDSFVDLIAAQASSNGGASWVTLLNMTKGTPLGVKSFNLLSSLGSVGPNTLIRFIRLAGGSAGKKITLDNVKITFSTPNGATTATSLLAGSAVVSGIKDVEVKMTVTSSVSATVTPPTALTLATTGTASATRISGPTPSSGSASPTGTVFSYQYRINSGSGIGSVRFSGVPAGPAGFSFAISQSQSVLTTAPLSFQATVNTPAPVMPITNVATLGDVGGLSQISPTATTATTATVGDMVWADLDGNGSQGPGEPGVAGVAVRVFADADQNGAPDGPALSSTLTDAAGRYRLYGLAAGSFVVGYDFSSVLPRSLPTTPLWHAMTLAEFEQYSTADFGIRPPLPIGDALQVSIGGRAWLDADLNAADDSAEPGISSLPVRIYADMNASGTVDLADALIASAVADASGNYRFSGLHAAAYLVDADESSPALSAGLQLAAGGAAPATGLQSVSPASGTTLVSINFGYQYASSISGMIFQDADLDDTADPFESGAAGAVVLLYLDANGNGVIDADEYALADTTSGPAGLYTFTRLAPSAYIVVVDDSTVRTAAGLTGLMVATTNRERTMTLGPLQALTGTDIGFTEAAVLRGHVFADTNANGRRDLNEAGLPAVAVSISGTPFMGGSFTATVDTAVLGQWSAVVPPGNYVVSYAAADPDIPAGLATATTPFDYAISAGSGETWADLDFGRDHTGTIQVVVFTDADSSGSQQAGEAGLSSVPVHLYSTEATPSLLATLLTDSSGHLVFTGLAGGDYTVTVDGAGIPAAYHAAPTADPDATKDGSHTVSLIDSGTAPQLSFGYATIALNHSISGVVFEDTDLSGDPMLPTEGRGGITVTAAVDADQNGTAEQLLTMLTAPGGAWSFAGIAANANVTISIDSSSLPSPAWVAVTDPDAVVDQQTTIASLNVDVIDRNFGYVQKFGSVSGRTVTGNGNGVADPTETGHAAVGLLFVYAGKDGIIGTGDDSSLASVTNGTGEYTRSGLIPGFYQITKTNPTGYRGQMDADGGNPDIIQLTVAADQTLTGQDFEIELSPITGRVFADTNGNGGQDPAEPNLVSREFFITDGSGTRSLTTGFDGSWSTTVQPGLPCYITVPIGPGFNYQTNLNDSHSEVGVPPVMDFYNGSFGGTIAPGGSLLVMLQVPSEAVRMRLIGTHSDAVDVRVNAGNDPGQAGSALWTSTGIINSLLSTPISAAPAPWQPGAAIYIRLVNTGTTPQPATIVSDGRTIATDDEDADGLPDAWETTHYGDPANGGGQSDPDFDGMDSLIEFLYGTSPTVPNGSEVPGSLVTTETSTTLTLVFNRPAVLPPALQLAIERSPNLEPNSWENVSQLNADGTWTVPGILTETAAGAGRVSTTATILQEGTSAHRMFYRLSLRAVP
jgi:uncharacterized repeat protein (TIGR01451 family)